MGPSSGSPAIALIGTSASTPANGTTTGFGSTNGSAAFAAAAASAAAAACWMASETCGAEVTAAILFCTRAEAAATLAVGLDREHLVMVTAPVGEEVRPQTVCIFANAAPKSSSLCDTTPTARHGQPGSMTEEIRPGCHPVTHRGCLTVCQRQSRPILLMQAPVSATVQQTRGWGAEGVWEGGDTSEH
jgi:hypothetical protein